MVDIDLLSGHLLMVTVNEWCTTFNRSYLSRRSGRTVAAEQSALCFYWRRPQEQSVSRVLEL